MQKESIIGVLFAIISLFCIFFYLIPSVGLYPTDHGPLKFEDQAQEYDFEGLATYANSQMVNVGKVKGNNPMSEVEATMSEGSAVRLPFPPAPRFTDPKLPSLPIGAE